MKKISVEVVGRVLLPVKVQMDVSVRMDEDGNLDRVIRQFAKGQWRMAKADVEDVEILHVETDFSNDFDGDPDATLEDHVGEFINNSAGAFKVLASAVTDSR